MLLKKRNTAQKKKGRTLNTEVEKSLWPRASFMYSSLFFLLFFSDVVESSSDEKELKCKPSTTLINSKTPNITEKRDNRATVAEPDTPRWKTHENSSTLVKYEIKFITLWFDEVVRLHTHTHTLSFSWLPSEANYKASFECRCSCIFSAGLTKIER